MKTQLHLNADAISAIQTSTLLELKTKNWKHIVGFIFNASLVEKWNL